MTIEQVANDFGVHPVTLSNWLSRAAVDDGDKPGVTTAEAFDEHLRSLQQAGVATTD